MKTVTKGILLAGLAIVPFLSSAANEPDSTGLPGDHFDLPGAMELFKKASSPADFEKALNTQSNHVNNLDLNGDNKIDYVKVVDRVNGKSHAIILRVNVSEDELQDVATILLEQTGDKTAQLQIVGNKDLYGEDVIMEPYAETEDKKSTGPSSMLSPMHVVVVNVWSWPCVQYIYDPYYDIYISPWYWGYYPSWWYPWQPYYWHVHYSYVYHYHQHMYHYTPYCTLTNAQTVYTSHRTSSPTVIKRYEVQRANYAANKRDPGSGAPGRKVENKAGTTDATKRQPGTTTTRKPVERSQDPTKREQQPAAQPQEPIRKETPPAARPQNPPAQNREPVQRQPQPVQRQPERVSPPPRQSQPQRVSPPQRAPQQMSRPAPQRIGNPGGGIRRGR
jgi:hypothetical protein